MSVTKLTKAMHKNFIIVDRVAFVCYKIPSSTVRNDIMVLLLSAVAELEKTSPDSEILAKLKVELGDIAP